jgi:hypothetical protein
MQKDTTAGSVPAAEIALGDSTPTTKPLAQREAEGRALAQVFTDRLRAIIDDMTPYFPSEENGPALADGMVNAFLSALSPDDASGPRLAGPARSWGGCAALGEAIFGPELLGIDGETSDESPAYQDAGSLAETAFFVGRVYLLAERLKRPAHLALLALATIAHEEGAPQ